jgi:hypothetical protein
MEIDFYYRNDTSVILLFPKTPQAYKWIAENLDLETLQNPDQIEIEPILFDDIIADILLEDLTISRLSL